MMLGPLSQSRITVYLIESQENDNSARSCFSTLKSFLESLPAIQIDVIIFN